MKRNKRGISLITLVITIIIMIILAGAIILTLTNSGIFDKANDAVSKYSLKEVQSIADLAWAEAFADGARDKDSLQAAVDKALEDNDLDDKYKAEADEKGVTVTEIGEGSGNQTSTNEYMIGDIVKVKGTEEYFYVIEESKANDSEVLLFAARGINTETLLQTEEPNDIVFSETQYWADGETNLNEEGIPDESHYATRAAYDYAKSLDENASGRLLTLAEAEKLQKENKFVLQINYASDGLTESAAYLGTRDSENNTHIWKLRSLQGGYPSIFAEESSNYAEESSNYSYVRPVVKIAKDKILGEIDVEADTELNLGDAVRIGDEIFCVWKECSNEEQYVEILAIRGIGTDLQQQGAFWGESMAFSSTNYWSAIDGITYPYDLNESGIPDESHYALRVAYDYGAKLGGTGRLLTYEEADNLKDLLSSIGFGIKKASSDRRQFWVSSAGDNEEVWTIWIGCENLGWDDELEDIAYGDVYTELRKEGYGKIEEVWDDNNLEYVYKQEDIYGVLPVIRIEKTKLSYFEF